MIGSYLIRSFFSSEIALDSYFYRQKRLLNSDPRCLMITSMPKSGSTFLSNCLANLLNYKHSYFSFAYYNIEQELYKPRIIDFYGKGTIVQQHFRANTPNLELLNEFFLRPTVLTRNVFDVVVSIRDHLLRERLDNLPSMYTPDKYCEMDPQDQFNFIIKYFGPWLISFYASWVMADKQGRIELQWLSYEECQRDWEMAIQKILNFYSIAGKEHAIADVLTSPGEAASRRFNKGVPGRGMALLNAAQISEIEGLTCFYPDVDFSSIGIAD